MHPFLKRMIIAVFVSAALTAGGTVMLLAASNELFSYQKIVETQDDILWGPAFGQAPGAYKLDRTKQVEPDILVLGSSRTTQFRAEMFAGARFYNASGATGNFMALEEFLRTLYGHFRPKLVIIGIDPWWFDPKRGRMGCQVDDGCWIFSYKALVANMFADAANPRFLFQLLFQPIDYLRDPVSSRRPIGFRATSTGDGYRPDGSHQYGMFLTDSDPYYDHQGIGFRNGFAMHKREAADRRGRFSYTGAIGQDRLEQLRRILSANKRQGVDTILFLPSFAHAFFSALMADSGQESYIRRIEQAVAGVAAEAGVEFYNFHDLAALGQSDAQTIDAIHPDEVAVLAAVQEMVRKSGRLARLVDAGMVDALVTRMTNKNARPNFHLIAR